MRIDREAFLLAATALAAACERAETLETDVAPLVVRAPEARPSVAPVRATLAEPTLPELTAAEPAPVELAAPVAPKAKAVRPLSAAKRWFLALSVQQRNNVTALCEQRRVNPCANFLREVAPRRIAVDGEDTAEDPDPEEKFLAGLSVPQRQQATKYCVERSGMPAPTCETPLVVALDNQPVEFRAATGDQFAFVPGTPMATDWPTAATPWIARDVDGDGAITSGAELFGSSTELGELTARNGFEALAALDANRDGTIDARDPAFAELLLWSDRDGDHRSSADELQQLSAVITAIPLAHELDVRCSSRDNCEGERGTVRWRDASNVERTGAVIDVYVQRR